MTSNSDPHTDQKRGGASSESVRPTPAEVDDAFKLLAHRHRRAILRYLDGADAPVSLETLAVDLAAMTATRSEDDHLISHSDQIRITLHHTHLPLLTDAGVVDYDHDRDRIALTESDSPISSLLTDVLDTTLDT